MSGNHGCGYKDFCWKWLCEGDKSPSTNAAYAYIYNLTPEDAATVIPANDPLPFNQTGIIKGITHPTSEQIQINETGIYEVTFYNNDGKNTFQLELGGVLIPGTKYEIIPSASIEIVQAIIKVATSGQILRVITLSGTTFKKGDPTVTNVSIYIEKIDEI